MNDRPVPHPAWLPRPPMRAMGPNIALQTATRAAARVPGANRATTAALGAHPLILRWSGLRQPARFPNFCANCRAQSRDARSHPALVERQPRSHGRIVQVTSCQAGRDHPEDAQFGGGARDRREDRDPRRARPRLLASVASAEQRALSDARELPSSVIGERSLATGKLTPHRARTQTESEREARGRSLAPQERDVAGPPVLDARARGGQR